MKYIHIYTNSVLNSTLLMQLVNIITNAIGGNGEIPDWNQNLGAGFWNWTQKHMGWDQRQNRQSPFQMPAIEEELTLVMPQLCFEYNTYGMEYLAGQFKVTGPVHSSPELQSFTFCTCNAAHGILQ